MEKRIKIDIHRLSFSYGALPVLRDISIQFREHTISAITGASGQGKSTLLKTLNRLWESSPGARMSGRIRIRFGGKMQDIHHPGFPLPELRRKVGMVFQHPNPLPMSIQKNIAFPLKLTGYPAKRSAHRVEQALKDAFLWDEVKDRLTEDARVLSGGQQQRLCIARALILEPEVLLLDEPTSSLDRKAGDVIESLLLNLKKRCTLLMVSHDLDQARRVGDRCLAMENYGFFNRPPG